MTNSTFLARHGMVSRALVGALLAGGSLALFNEQASADTHVTVRSGDTLSNLATAYDSTVNQIAQKNHIKATDTLYLGEQLDIPNDRPDEWVGTDRSTVDANKLAQAGIDTLVWNSDSGVDDQTDSHNNSQNADSRDVAKAVNVSANQGQQQTVSASTSYANAGAYNNGDSGASYNGSNNASQSVSAPVAQNASYSNNSGNGYGQYTPAQAVQRAQSQVGVPYVWGGTTPGRGFDCSGLVQWAYGLAPANRTTYTQQTMGTHHYDVENAQSGDIYFWGSDNAPHHEALATGNGGYIQAPQPGQNVQYGNINAYQPNYYVSMQ